MLACGLAGQPYLLREVKQELKDTANTISIKSAIKVRFILRVFVSNNEKRNQLFYKYTYVIWQMQSRNHADLCHLKE